MTFSFVNQYSKATMYEYQGSLSHIKKNQREDKNKLSLGQRIVTEIKNFILYIPTYFTACKIQQYLFPEKGCYNGSWDNRRSFESSTPSFLNSFRCECCEQGYRRVQHNHYLDHKYIIRSNEGRTALGFSRLIDRQNRNPDYSERQLFLFFQGNGMTLNDFDRLKAGVVKKNTDFCMMDWPKHGRSKGALTHQSLLEQAELAYQFAVSHLGYSANNVHVKGVSLGCYQAVSLVERHPEIASLELDQPFSTMEKISRAELLSQSDFRLLRLFGSLMKRAIKRYYDFNNMTDIAQLSQFKGEIKIIRRTNDSLTSLDKDDLKGSCLTNEVIKAIIEAKYVSEFEYSTPEQRSLWMDEYLAQKKPENGSNDISLENDKIRLYELLAKIVTDKHVNIADK